MCMLYKYTYLGVHVKRFCSWQDCSAVSVVAERDEVGMGEPWTETGSGEAQNEKVQGSKPGERERATEGRVVKGDV